MSSRCKLTCHKNPARAQRRVEAFWIGLTDVTEAKVTCYVPRLAVTQAVRVNPTAKSEYKRRVEVSLPLLVIKPGTWFPETDIEDNVPLLVRDHYATFLAIIRDRILLRQPPLIQGDRPVRHAIIAGTPGTGKTCFGRYLLCNLGLHCEFEDWKIIWEEAAREAGPSVSYFFRGIEALIGKVGDFDDLADGTRTVFLVNGPALRPQHKLSKVVMFSSNKDEAPYTKQFLKETRTRVLYMPTWDVCELALLYASRTTVKTAQDFNIIKDRYEQFGGSARAVCDQFDSADYNSRFLAALDNANSVNDLDIVRALRQDRESSSYIFHLKVLDSTYTTAAVTYASPYVKSRLEAERLVSGIKEAIQYIERKRLIPEEAVVVGRKFEYLVHSLVTKANKEECTFRSRDLLKPGSSAAGPSTSSSTATASSGTVCLHFGSKLSHFHKLKDVKADCPGYYVPDYCPYPCYDSLALLPDGECWLLQITRNVEHDALFGFVDAAIQRFKVVRFFYVVPEGLFASYPYQRLMWGKQERNWPCRISVVGIPDAAFLGLLGEPSFKRMKSSAS